MRKPGFILFFLLYSLHSMAGRGIERINFFPDSDAFLHAGYNHTQLKIETPREAVNTKELVNIYNQFEVTYSHRTARKWFVGVTAGIEEASENAAIYGIPLRRRFTSAGFVNPTLSSLYRLRHQKDKRGNIDAHIFFSPNLGPRRISRDVTNRFTGKNALGIALSHGFHEEKWEFKNQLSYRYYSAGREENEFLNQSFRLENVYEVDYAFMTQYSLSDHFYIFLSLGVFYRSNERIREDEGGLRELKSGSGSRHRLGLKQVISEWSLVELSYGMQKSEYFLKADNFSLDGEFISQNINFTYTVLF